MLELFFFLCLARQADIDLICGIKADLDVESAPGHSVEECRNRSWRGFLRQGLWAPGVLKNRLRSWIYYVMPAGLKTLGEPCSVDFWRTPRPARSPSTPRSRATLSATVQAYWFPTFLSRRFARRGARAQNVYTWRVLVGGQVSSHHKI